MTFLLNAQENEQHKGFWYIVTQAILWGLFPVVTTVSFHSLTPLWSLVVSAFFSSIFFAVIISIRGRWHEVFQLRAIGDILGATICIGILYYGLTFYGLQHTSAGNASVLSLAEVLFSFLLFNVWHKEMLSRAHILGALLMLGGAVIVLYPNVTQINYGDVSIVAAAFFAPFGNYFQRRARRVVASETIMLIRSVVSAGVVAVAAVSVGDHFSLEALGQSWKLLFLNGVVLLGVSKLLWIEGIHRMSVTIANALSCLSPVITLIAAWMVLGQMPTVWQIFSLFPLAIGTVLLSKPAR